MSMSLPPLEYRSRRWFAMAAAVTALAGLSVTPTIAQQDVITFGAALSLTGKTSTEGRLVKEGYDLYVQHINERGGFKVGNKNYRVAIKYYDDQSDANTSAKLYERLITEDGIKLLLGPYSSGITFAASPVAEKYQVPMVAAHAATRNAFTRSARGRERRDRRAHRIAAGTWSLMTLASPPPITS